MEQSKIRVEAESRMQIDLNKQQAEAQQKLQEAQNEAELDAMRQQFEHEREMAKMANEAAQRELDRYKVDADNATKIEVALIQADEKRRATELSAQTAMNASMQQGANDGNA